MPLIQCLVKAQIPHDSTDIEARVKDYESKGKSSAEAEAIVKNEIINQEYGKLHTDLQTLKEKVLGEKANPNAAPPSLPLPDFTGVNKKYQDAKSKYVESTGILPILDKVKQAISKKTSQTTESGQKAEPLAATNDVLTRVNNAESINEGDIKNAEDELYTALDAAPEAAHLIEPLIQKLQDYEFTTKTKTSRVTEEVATEVARPARGEKKPVSKSLAQWEGNRATITDPKTGKKVEGIIRVENGKYSLHNDKGEKVAAIGEKQLTDRDISLPRTEDVPRPFEVDNNGDVKSITLQLHKTDMTHVGNEPSQLVTVHFKDPEKALDYAIQLRAEQVGEVPQPEFDVVYNQVEKEIKTEVPTRNLGGKQEIGVSFAPFREKNVATLAEDADIRNSPDYKLHQENVAEIAKGLGIKVLDKADTWGGYVDTETGKPVQEVSNVIHIEATPEQAELMAAILGKAAPEMQDSVLVGNYGDYGKGIEHTISTGSFENSTKALGSLKENGLEYFTVDKNTGDITILDLDNSMSENIRNFVNKLKADGYETNHKLQSVEGSFIGREDYDRVISERGGNLGNKNGFDINAFVEKTKAKYDEIAANKKAAEEKSAAEKKASDKSTTDKTSTTNNSDTGGTGKEPPPKLGGGEPVFDSEGDGAVGIRHVDTAELRAEHDLPEYEKEAQTQAEWNAEATKRIKNGEMPALLKKMRKGEPISEVEQKMMGKYLAALDAVASRTKDDKDIARLKEAVDLSDSIGGSATGRSLVARKGLFSADETLGGFFIRQQEASQVDTLTKEQKDENEKEFEGIKAAQDANAKAITELQKQVSKLKADMALRAKEAEANKPSSSPTLKAKEKKTHDDFVAQRKNLVEKLKAQKEAHLKKLKDEGIHTKSIGGNKLVLTTDMAKTIGEIAKSHLEEVGSKLSEVAKRTLDDVKDLFGDGITEQDIHDVIAGEYEPKKTKSELSEKWHDLRTEAKLMTKLKGLLEGEVPKQTNKHIKYNQEVTKLKKDIAAFRKDAPYDAKSLNDIIARNEKEAKRIQDQIDKGDFSQPQKRTPVMDDEMVKKNFPDLYKKAMQSQDALIKVKQAREVRLLKEVLANRTLTEKAKDNTLEILNIPRTLMASVDFSAPLRQGIIPTIAHPILAVKAFKQMFAHAKSQAEFDRWFVSLRQDPDFHIMEKSGLYIADPHNHLLAAKEEMFMNNLAEKIPFFGTVLVKGSERAYVSYLNKMRVDLFKQGEQLLIDRGKTLANSENEYKKLASWVNNSTGRGGLTDAGEKMAPVLNSIFFSPRLIASRLNLMNPLYYKSLPPQVRRMAAWDMVKFVGFGLSVLGVAKMLGAEVEDDWRSTDFGKIKVGDTRYDIWGGFQQYVRLIGQVFTGKAKALDTGKIRKIDGSGRFGESQVDLLSRFGRGKLAPIPATLVDLLSGRTIMGQKIVYTWGGNNYFTFGNHIKAKEISITDELAKEVIPLLITDVTQSAQQGGLAGFAETVLPATFGIGVQTFNKKHSKSDPHPEK